MGSKVICSSCMYNMCMYIYIYIHTYNVFMYIVSYMYIYIYIYRERDTIYTYIYIYMYTHVYICVYTHISSEAADDRRPLAALPVPPRRIDELCWLLIRVSYLFMFMCYCLVVVYCLFVLRARRPPASSGSGDLAFIKGGCSRTGVQWMGGVLRDNTAYHIV